MAHEAQPTAHEPPDVNTGRVLMFVGGFVGFVLLLGFGLSLYYRFITAGETLTPVPRPVPAPQLQPDPGKDWTRFRDAQQKQLEGYAWADRGRALVHIPIERAMALVAARGQAGYDPVEGTPPFPAPGSPPLDGAPRAEPTMHPAPYGLVR